ncbi:hypothetical protein [Cellulomonas terrae]|uniref:Uncharacterized protein n=1 Tax=Cellulomonas terrae TaxID=311234 RepID=A0A511JJI0_9CELL|nr:hypothetical protein [Cellulomonas terrae]GEL98170.1 hypothetical protein CTE05_17170 [Cellulomonas terrae]
MALTYDEAVAVQRQHEARLIELDGVNAVGVKQTDSGLVLEVTVSPDVDLPSELDAAELDGLPLKVVRGGYTLQ